MASEKKVILVFADCPGSALLTDSPALAKLLQKGTLLSCVKSEGNRKSMAASGAKAGENLWDAATKQNFVVASLKEKFDMCVLDTDAAHLEPCLAEVLEVSDRATLVVIVADGAVLFYGPGIAKGKVVEEEYCVCTVAPTVAYMANFPVPENCVAPIAYVALKDINFKLNEVRKYQDAITNMEAAIERKSRQPWDKHDCA